MKTFVADTEERYVTTRGIIMNENNRIKLSKYVEFDKEHGTFFLTCEAAEIIYREKRVICSYSGGNEWVNDMMLGLLDLFTGASPYNYALNSVFHKEVMPSVWESNKGGVINFIESSVEKEWGIAMYKTIDMMIDNLPSL